MTVQVRGAVSDGEAASATRYRVELEGAGGTMRIPCAPGVFPHHSTLVPFISAFRGSGVCTGEVRLVDATDGTVIARRRLECPSRPYPRQTGIRDHPRQRRPPMNDNATGDRSRPLAVSGRAKAQLVHLHRRAELPTGVAIAIQPGERPNPRFAAKRPDASDRVVATREDGSPLLVVPAQAVDAVAGALLDFVLTPEPGFVVLP